LRLIAGLEKPTGGIIKIAGQRYSGPNPKATLVFQQYSLFPWRNVLDNVAFGLEVSGVQKKKRHEIARRLLSLVELDDFEKSYPYELSGGMQQRVAIARALANNADILLMDEPFGALDERTRHRLQEELLSIWEREQKTIILVTHNIGEAIFLADRILIMTDRPGRILDEVKVKLKRPRGRLSGDFTDYYIHIRLLFERIIASRG
jgi:NitT/TauT family transport system ATP-binding protein